MTENEQKTAQADEYESDIPRELAMRAYYGMSMTPDRRGAQVRSEYASALTEDREAFLRAAQAGGTLALVEEEFARYRQGLRKRWIDAIRSDSRCVSWFIAGPSKFPVARMNKRADIASRRWTEVFEYRKRAKVAILRKLRPDLAPILSSDSDASERLREKLAEAKRRRDLMKAANVALRTHSKAGREAQIAALETLGISSLDAHKLTRPDSMGRVGYTYHITSLGAEIRRLNLRLQQVERLQSQPDTAREGANARIEDCPSENRVRVFFPGKPPEQTRELLKRGGFRWAPSLGAWQAYRNRSSLDLAVRVAGITTE